MVRGAFVKLTVFERRERTPDVVSFILKHPNGDRLAGFSAGAHINVEVELGAEGIASRSYSLVNSSNDETVDHYHIAVLRQSDGRGGSAYMHDALVPGSLVEVSAPVNGFPLSDGARRYTLVAGGIGITPILSMARALAERGAAVDLHYFGRSADSMAFLDELRNLLGEQLRQYHEPDPAAARQRLADVIGAPEDGRQLYVCGPSGMIQSVIEIAEQASWNERDVRYELFSGQVIRSSNRSFTIHLVRSSQRVEVAADSNILDTLLANGVDVPFDCRTGVCGSCLTPVCGGQIDHRDTYLTEEDRIDGGLMCVCVSRSMNGTELELDI